MPHGSDATRIGQSAQESPASRTSIRPAPINRRACMCLPWGSPLSVRTMAPASRDITTPKGGKPTAKRGGISAKTRKAVELIAHEGITQAEAARRVGMHSITLCRALAKPHVRALLDAKKLAFAEEVDQLRETAKKKAILVALELMQPEQPASVRARMVEFFAGEAKRSGPSVTVNVESPAYAYIRPGEKLVDVTPMDDNREANDAPDSGILTPPES